MTDQAYKTIKHRIITCELLPGLDLSEHELAQQLQMSKTPVREALARLCLEGFTEAFPRRGYRITPVAAKDINELFTVRGVLEGAAGEMAAKNMPDEEIEHLLELSEATYTPDEPPSVEGFIHANLDFHSAIARGSGVVRLENMITALLDEATRFFYMGAINRDVNPETSEDHREIVDHLRKQSVAKARKALINHSENTRLGLLTVLISDRQSEIQF